MGPQIAGRPNLDNNTNETNETIALALICIVAIVCATVLVLMGHTDVVAIAVIAFVFLLMFIIL